MNPISHPSITDIVSAPARSREHTPVRDEDKFEIPDVEPVSRVRRDRAGDTANDRPSRPADMAKPDPRDRKVGLPTDTDGNAGTAADAVPAAAETTPKTVDGTQAATTAVSENPAAEESIPSPTAAQATGNAQTAAANSATTNIAQLVSGAGSTGQTPAQTPGTELASPSAAATAQTVASATAPQSPGTAGILVAQQAAAAQAGIQTPAQSGHKTGSQTSGLQTDGRAASTAASQTGASAVLATVNGPLSENAATGSSSKPKDGGAASSALASGTAVTDSGSPAPSASSQSATAANGQTPPQNNSQLLAQAMASATAADPAVSGSPAPVSPAVSGDTLGVTQSFNAEMRAAINAPTQAAAYTARGAVTPQPATEQIAMQISRAADQNVDRLSVQLKPAELGKVTIDLEIGPDNRLIAVISAERSETLDLLQRDARSLEKALNEAGVKTDSGSLEFNLQGDDGAAQNGRDDETHRVDGAIMLPGENGQPDMNGLPERNPLILPEGRIDIQV
tara:strand:+ start:4766 stop:6295 length:1530 start_codon:yes stop_codon:yes gene_type:complete